MDSDLPAINGIHLSAFGNPLGQEIVELVDGLLADETAKPLLSLVAETEEHIVGHVLFTNATLECGDRAVAARILAPLAVEKGSQAKGIGGLLIKEGLKRLANSGCAASWLAWCKSNGPEGLGTIRGYS